VDRYESHLVVQSLVPGVERLLDRFTGLLVELLAPDSVLARNDSSMRELEGLPREVRPLFGRTPATVEIREGGVRMAVDLAAGQKTGAFLDQRENRIAAAGYARGRALDLFCYHGAFALHAAARCDSVVAVDSSAAAIARGRANAGLNGRDNIEFVEANVFEFLTESAGRGYETIFLDPPAFAKRRGDLAAALRAYKDVNMRALRLLAPGGVLVTSSCSYNLSGSDFLSVLRDAAADARRTVRVVERRGASRDHPVRLGLPESAYLKCIVLHA
jgi:23S rRNA (cytosine1962-C5)-methyltransferase